MCKSNCKMLFFFLAMLFEMVMFCNGVTEVAFVHSQHGSDVREGFSDKTKMTCGWKIPSAIAATRRSFVIEAASLLFSWAVVLKQPGVSYASEEDTREITTSLRKPWAPTEALLPATRVRLLLNRALDLAEKIAKEKGVDEQEVLMKELDAILVSPKKPGEINNNGNKSIRISFDMYTSMLRFGEAYTVNASPEEKSAYIRKYDQLPDVKQVIASDLDLRDLYRNQVLTNVDEARAELRYQMDEFDKQKQQQLLENRNNLPKFDGEECVRLLKNAKESCDEWFGLIADSDIEAALEIVLEQSNGIKN